MNDITKLHNLQSKSSPEEIKGLIKDYNEIILSFGSSKRTKNTEKLQKYIEDLINYSKGELDKIDIISSFDPYHEVQLSEDKAEILDFYRFLTENEEYLSNFYEIPNFMLQQAYNHAASGPVHQQAKKLLSGLKGNNSNITILPDHKLPQYRKYPILHKKFQAPENTRYFSQKLIITPDGKKALTYQFNLVLWNLESGENILLDDNYSCYAADITPDGRWALTSDGETITLWDLDERISIKTICSKHSFKIIIRADGQRAIVIFDYNLKLYDLSTWEVIKEISCQDELYSFSISADFKTAVWISNYNLIVYDFENDKIVKIIRGRGLMATPTTTISPDGSKVLCLTYHRINYLWDIEKGEFMDRIGDSINDVTHDFKLAITGDNPGELLDLTRLKKLSIFINEAKTIKNLNEGVEYIKDSKITVDGRKGVSLDQHSNICIWDLEKGESLSKKDGTLEN